MTRFSGAGGPFIAVASPKRLVLGAGEAAVFTFPDPMLESWEVLDSWERLHSRYQDEVCTSRPSEVRCSLNFLCRGSRTGEPITDFRFADDMTIRELLATIDRKLKRRE